MIRLPALLLAALLAVPSVGLAAIANPATTTCNFSSSVAVCSPAGSTIGNVFLVGIQVRDTATAVVAVTVSGEGSVATLDSVAQNCTNATHIQQFAYLTLTAGGAKTVTVTVSGTPGSAGTVTVWELSGVDAAIKDASHSDIGSTGSDTATGTVTTNFANSAIFVLESNSFGGGPPTSPGAGYTQQTLGNDTFFNNAGAEYDSDFDVGAAGAKTPTMMFGNSNASWCMLPFAVKAAGGGGGGTAVPVFLHQLNQQTIH